MLDESLGADPAALASIEERLGAIYSLCHKHHVADADGLIDLRDSLREKLRALDSSDETLEELERDARRAKALAERPLRKYPMPERKRPSVLAGG